MATVTSVNAGRARDVPWRGKLVTTAIFKSPLKGPVLLERHQLEGDEQADRSVHGGEDKAVYIYPTEHYEYWQDKIGDEAREWGSFGENLTVSGIHEQSVHVGDEFRIGGARVRVTEPRMPCFKLSLRFNRPEMVKWFLASRRTGFYCAVVEEGSVEAGNDMTLVSTHPDGLTIDEVVLLYSTERSNEELLKKAVAVDALPASWRAVFERQIAGLGSRPEGSEVG